MKITTKLLFGIRNSETISLVVTTDGTLPAQPPDLEITTGGQAISIPCSDNAWSATLDSGDHTVRLSAANDSWFDGAVAFTLSAPATIVSRESATSTNLVTFTVTAGTASPARDPKNPWPPPLVGKGGTPLVEPTWIGSKLALLGDQVSTDRSAHEPVAPTAASAPARRR
jgi:hypothetical protein